MSYIDVSGKVKKEYKLIAENVASQVILFMGYPAECEVAIEFVSEKEIQRLNKSFRNVDRVTDVLSFPAYQINVGEVLSKSDPMVSLEIKQNGFVHLGDMAICLEQTKRQAEEFGVSEKSEIKKLVIHSMLHLMGYDHIEDSDYEVMHKKEIELDKIILI